MSLERRLHQAAEAIDELHGAPAQVAADFHHFLGTVGDDAPAGTPAQAGPDAAAVDHRPPPPRGHHQVMDPAQAGPALDGNHAPGMPMDQRVPGLILLSMDLNVLSLSPPAARWLEHMGWDGGPSLPEAIVRIAEPLVTSAGEPEGRHHAVQMLPDGPLVEFEAWTARIDGDFAIVVAVVPAGPTAHLEYLMVDTYRLTRREVEVARLVLLGSTTPQIAMRLHISEYTVQDHLRRIFSKSGCHSRREFTEKAFMIYFEGDPELWLAAMSRA
jgi:DNA-binding CsgD family transcriptional regulator